MIAESTDGTTWTARSSAFGASQIGAVVMSRTEADILRMASSSGQRFADDSERIRRTARALQAMTVAQRDATPAGKTLEEYQADIDRHYARCISWSDEEATGADNLTGDVRGSWGWWAKRILAEADREA